MADIKPAVAGEAIPHKARVAWAKRLRIYEKAGLEKALDQTPTHVAEKSPGNRGAWFCLHCGKVHRNNMEAHSHADRHPKHAWLSLDSDRLEAP
jgi:hypothetical protein